MKFQRIGQVWIETVLYTIIGLALIGLVLSFVMPKINQSKDNLVVSQSIDTMKQLDSSINEVVQQQGDIKKININVGRGYLYINASSGDISLVINDLTSLYSESNVTLVDGNLQILSMKGQKTDSVYLTLNYPYNITYNGKNTENKITAAPIPYSFYIENKGNNQIDISSV